MSDILDALAVEQAAFDAALDSMMTEHAGLFALFHRGAPVGFFPTYGDAYRAGLERLGPDTVFLVSEVRERIPEAPSISWCTGAMFVQV